MRNMSFAETTEQAWNRTKTVTRRWGWGSLGRGDRVQQVVKVMGLKRDEKITKIHVIEIIGNRPDPLDNITDDECVREGLEFLTVAGLQNLLLSMKPRKCRMEHPNRIEFKYIN